MGISMAALDLARSIMDRALNSEKGVKVAFASEGLAIQFRQRCYTARAKDRALSRKIYDETDLRWGKSSYDSLVVTVTPNKSEWAVLVQPATEIELPVEEL